jgi:hypothetical protein
MDTGYFINWIIGHIFMEVGYSLYGELWTDIHGYRIFYQLDYWTQIHGSGIFFVC